MNNGYNFYFSTSYGDIVFPITPSELTVSSGSQNSVVTLIDEGEVNILKSPSLTEVSFEARFPMRKYPYSREVDSFQDYFDIFAKLKEEKKSFRFIVARTTPNNTKTWDTNLLVSLESLETSESADEGDDVIVSFELKQYKPYGVKILPNVEKPTTTSTASGARDSDSKNTGQQNYTIKSGDTLWGLAKKYYGDGSTWKKIYTPNKDKIEADARAHGRKSSSTGHWIYPGLTITIPAK